MPYVPFSFFSNSTQPSQLDASQQMGMNQYTQQGQNQISPGQAQVTQSSPVAAGGMANLGKTLQQMQQQPQLPAQQGAPSSGPNAPMGNLPVAPGQYQSPQALQNAQGPLYPSPYAAQQAQPWLSRMADALMSNNGSNSGGSSQ